MRVLILGAGFGGLELATCLSDALGDRVTVTLIDKNDSFVFGYAKVDVMFGKQEPAAVRLPYRAITKSGVEFRQDAILRPSQGGRRAADRPHHATRLRPSLRRGGHRPSHLMKRAKGADFS